MPKIRQNYGRIGEVGLVPVGDRVFRTFRTEVWALNSDDDGRGVANQLFSDTYSQEDASGRASQ